MIVLTSMRSLAAPVSVCAEREQKVIQQGHMLRIMKIAVAVYVHNYAGYKRKT